MNEQLRELPRDERWALERSLSILPGMALNKTEVSILNPQAKEDYHNLVVRFWRINKQVEKVTPDDLHLRAKVRAYFDWKNEGGQLGEPQEQIDARFIEAANWEAAHHQAAKELIETISRGEVNLTQPLTDKEKRETAYLTWEVAGKPFEGKKEAKARFEQVAGELERQRVEQFKNVLETWGERVEELAKARLGGESLTPEEILEKRIEVEEGAVEQRVEKEVEEGERLTRVIELINAGEGDKVSDKDLLFAYDHGYHWEEIKEGPFRERLNRLLTEREEEFKKTVEEEVKPEGGEPEKPEEVKPVPEGEKLEEERPSVEEELRREKVLRALKTAVKNWWWSISPQRRNKIIWGLGVGVGLGESFFVADLLPGIAWIKGIANMAVINGINLALSKSYTRGINTLKEQLEGEKGKVKKEEIEQKLSALEKKYTKGKRYLLDFASGVAAGSVLYGAGRIVYTAGEAAYQAYFRQNILVGPVGPVEAITPSPAETPTLRVTPTPEAEVVTPDFFNQVVEIKDPGDTFWRSLEVPKDFFAPTQENGWVNPLNGVTQEDVIRDLVIKFARANGKELGLVHVGDTFKLKDLLTPDQMEIVRKALATKSATDYWTNIRPLFLAVLKK
jgi:hypothetical protein